MIRQAFTRNQVQRYLDQFRQSIKKDMADLLNVKKSHVTPVEILSLIESTKCPHEFLYGETKKVSQDSPNEPEMPFNSQPFKEAWEEFKKLRKLKRLPLTDTAIKRQFSMLKKHPEEIAIKMVQQSCDRGWTGIFELKDFSKEDITASGKQQSQFKGKF